MNVSVLSFVDQPQGEDVSSPYAITDQQFNFLRGIARKHAGIALGDHKKNMVQRRVTRRITQLGLGGFKAYCAYVESSEGQKELEQLINVLTTNKTDFFRENHHFDHLAKVVLPMLIERLNQGKQKRLRIWSAGCSSGQEPYTIAMTVLANMPDVDQYDVKILATDIDTEILAKAARGVYNELELSGLPHQLRGTCLRPEAAQPGHFKILPQIQRLVAFRHLNLHDDWPMSGTFDLIFCRNTVIYFDKPTQCRLFDRFADILVPGGFIYIGHSESLFKVSERFQFEGQSIYRKIS
jgi:chemotaxis protein methyltransferase CheR